MSKRRNGSYKRAFLSAPSSITINEQRTTATPMLLSLSEYHTIGFCGSRILPTCAISEISSLVHTAIATSSAQIVVGCSVGADESVLNAIPCASANRCFIFASFGPEGVGSGNFSAVKAVERLRSNGASITWWAGGTPEVPMHQRLALRSVALARFLGSHQPSALLSFLGSPESRGSLITLRRALSLGVDGYVHCVGFHASCLPRFRKNVVLF
jgi:hypothetical protein